MNPTYDFNGQVALVTGAGGGMGLATAQAFAAAGAAVVLADVDEDAAAGRRRRADRRRPPGARRRLRRLRRGPGRRDWSTAPSRRFGRLDMAFNNAGIMIPPSDAADEPAENFDRVNADQPARRLGLHEARAAADARAGQRRDRQLLLARRARRLPGRASYHATKHGVSA